MMYSCIKAETTSDANYVRFSVGRQKVKATLCGYPRMQAGIRAPQ